VNLQEYMSYDGIGLAELVANKQVSAKELLELCIAAIAGKNPNINAVVNPLFDAARSTADKPLSGQYAGVPFLLKDLGQYMAGIPTTSGSRLFANVVKDHDSTLVQRYRKAGLVICGKTNTPELGLATTTEPQLHGPTKNPVNTQYSPGGSSGGAAAAVASGMVPMAHASDGGGSIRVPASCCGLIGLKPTRGRVPLGPDALEGWGGLSTTHAVTRSVRDSATLLDISSGEEPGAPYYGPPKPRSFRALAERDPKPLTLGLCLQAFSGSAVDPQVKAAAEAAAKSCEQLGHQVQPGQPDITPQIFKDAHGIVAIAQVTATINERLAQIGRNLQPADIERVTERNYTAGNTMTAAQYAWAQNKLREQGLAMARYFEAGIDVLITPTMAVLPPELGALDMMSDDDTTYLALLYGMIGFTALMNDTGLPAISLPLGTSKSGLPIGVQFIAPMGGEGLLLSLAGQLERAGLLRVTAPQP
jgi:amidase